MPKMRHFCKKLDGRRDGGYSKKARLGMFRSLYAHTSDQMLLVNCLEILASGQFYLSILRQNTALTVSDLLNPDVM